MGQAFFKIFRKGDKEQEKHDKSGLEDLERILPGKNLVG